MGGLQIFFDQHLGNLNRVQCRAFQKIIADHPPYFVRFQKVVADHPPCFVRFDTPGNGGLQIFFDQHLGNLNRVQCRAFQKIIADHPHGKAIFNA